MKIHLKKIITAERLLVDCENKKTQIETRFSLLRAFIKYSCSVAVSRHYCANFILKATS
jgi:hypothetical protein